jgi:predicted ribosomally synthesized peptide with SipW-like signal peptide
MTQREIRYRPPIEPVADASTRRLRDVSGAIAAAVLAMLVLGSGPLAAWTQTLPVNPVSDALVELAGDWDDWMRALGPGEFHPALRRLSETATK